MEEKVKRCSGCKKILPYAEFHKNKNDLVHGLQSHCKCCQKQYQREHYIPKPRLSGVGWIKKYRPQNLEVIKRRDTCVALQVHKEIFKDDPDHLTTDFMQKILGRKCE